jgi:hypothetical protein
MRRLFAFAGAVIALVLFAGLVHAQTVQDALNASDTVVVVPLGSWLERSLMFVRDIIIPGILGVAVFIAGKIYPAAILFLRSKYVEQLLTRAVDYGIQATVGATKDKKLEINVGNQVIANALDYAVQQGPTHILNWLGGAEAIRRMIFARLNFEDDASAAKLGVKTPDYTTDHTVKP